MQSVPHCIARRCGATEVGAGMSHSGTDSSATGDSDYVSAAQSPCAHTLSHLTMAWADADVCPATVTQAVAV